MRTARACPNRLQCGTGNELSVNDKASGPISRSRISSSSDLRLRRKKSGACGSSFPPTTGPPTKTYRRKTWLRGLPRSRRRRRFADQPPRRGSRCRVVAPLASLAADAHHPHYLDAVSSWGGAGHVLTDGARVIASNRSATDPLGLGLGRQRRRLGGRHGVGRDPGVEIGFSNVAVVAAGAYVVGTLALLAELRRHREDVRTTQGS